ncbi:hypothetical protein LCGC14_1559210 [marine sediment metagenome]|uniref:Uncharacterized protein n=1 Tax=marine sediment metagenome TaxID=412755 RepID=A0A0F9L4F0_9ZZZZ
MSDCSRCEHPYDKVKMFDPKKKEDKPSPFLKQVVDGIVYSCTYNDGILYQCGCIFHGNITY